MAKKTYSVHLTRDTTETCVLEIRADSPEEALENARGRDVSALHFERNDCSEGEVYDNGAEEIE